MVMPNIDDLSPLNDNGICEKYKSHIYPDDLDLNRENTGFKSASVLRDANQHHWGQILSKCLWYKGQFWLSSF